jgi:hypothetical protein
MMGEDNPTEETMPFVYAARLWFVIRRDHWLRKCGVDIYRDHCMSVYLKERWRFIWHNPRFRDNWRIDGTCNEGVWQIELGPAVLVYVRSEDF